MGVLQPFEVLPEHSLRTRNRLRAIHGKRGAGVRHRSISDGVVLHPGGRRDEHGRLLALPGAGRRTRVWRWGTAFVAAPLLRRPPPPAARRPRRAFATRPRPAPPNPSRHAP